MKEIQLTHRLAQIAKYVLKGEIVADIGTDHGYIPIYLAGTGICNRVYAMDINEGPIKSAKKNSRLYGVDEKVIVRQSNGLEYLEEDVNTVIIAGMGGHLVKDILEKDCGKLEEVDKLILSPHNDVSVVRKAVHSLGYCIVDEDFIKDEHKHYNVIVCKKGCETYKTEKEYTYSKKLIEKKNKSYEKFLISREIMYNKIMGNLENNNSESARNKKDMIGKELIEIKEVIACLQR